MKTCLTLIHAKDNKYTVNILRAAIEYKVPNVTIYTVRWDKDYDVIQKIAILNEKCERLLIGFTFMSTQLMSIINHIKMIRKAFPNIILIAGGPHASGDPLGTLTNLGFDLVVYGEGEDTMVEMLSSIINGGDPYVCGTAYIDGDKMMIKKRSRYVDLDIYPPFPYWRNAFNPIEIMRGCSASCYFCQVTYLYGVPRYRSIERIVYYSEIMLSSGLKDLRFIAPNSLGYGSSNGIKPDSKVLDLLQQLKLLVDRYGGRIFFGTFPSEVRPDSVEEDFIREIRKFVNNKRIIVGAQSGSNRILRIIHRGHTSEDIVNAVQILTKYGFEVDIDLIFGFPFETKDDIEETMKLIEKLKEYRTRFHLHTFIPLPGTPFIKLLPSPIDDTLKHRLYKLIGEGRAYGYWISQEKLSKGIIELVRKNIIFDLEKNYRNAKIHLC